MFSRIKLLKVISIILTLIFFTCSAWIILYFFSSHNDINYFNTAEDGCGFFVAVVAEKVAVAEEIKELKKQIEKLQK